MKIKQKFHYNIFKQNKNESLLTNSKKFNATLKIRKNTKKKHFIKQNKNQKHDEKISRRIIAKTFEDE